MTTGEDASFVFPSSVEKPTTAYCMHMRYNMPFNVNVMRCDVISLVV